MDSLRTYVLNSPLTAAELLVELNAKTETVYVNIPTIEIKRYLILNDLWLAIKAGTQNVAPEIAALCQTVIDTLEIFTTLHYTNTEIRAKTDYMLDALYTVGILTSTQVLEIRSLGSKKVTKVSQYGFATITQETLQRIKDEAT